jgi:hypothetical protein
MIVSQQRIAQFWARVDKRGDCWIFDTVSRAEGYGSFSLKSKQIGAHRFAYIITHGSIPKGAHIDHLCRVRACVNPDHLQAVSQKLNMARGQGASAQNALKARCKRGHVFDEANTLLTGEGLYRRCRACKRDYEAQLHQQKVQEQKRQGTYIGPNQDKTHCIYGHPFSATNTMYGNRSNGKIQRICRTCRNLASKRMRLKKKASAQGVGVHQTGTGPAPKPGVEVT